MTSSHTFLLFGGLHEDGSPDCALIHRGNEAYENYMLGPYMRELLAVRTNESYICWSPGFEHLFAAMVALGVKTVRFEELGSTLFSTIDKIDKLAARFPQLGSQPLVQYHGIEVSRLLKDVADAMHPLRIAHFKRWQDMPIEDVPIISRSYQSTSYAFRSTKELFDWIRRSAFGIHGVRFALEPGDHTIKLAGNDHTFFDPDEFADLANWIGLDVMVVKSEIDHHRSYPFAMSWLACSRLDAAAAQLKAQIVRTAGWPALSWSHELSRRHLATAPRVSQEIPWLFYGPGKQPFDFRHADLKP